MSAIGLYIHIPFCMKRCSYCDFNTYAGKLTLVPAYIDALCHEIEKVCDSHKKEIKINTIYFGGGTPSIIPISQLKRVLNVIRNQFILDDQIEATIEANPGTLTSTYLVDLLELGFNRLSLGMQSADPLELKLLGRIHALSHVVDSFTRARQKGFKNINLDLIYGIPGQKLSTWKSNLERAISLQPDHLSLYALTLEGHVPMERWIEAGKTPIQDEDLMADMYELASGLLDQNGFIQYEISNWAKPDARGEPLVCKHNLHYWLNEPYLGFGAGAHGYVHAVRTENLHRIGAFIQHSEKSDAAIFPCGPALKRKIIVDRWLEMQETMMVGLRLTIQGISKQRFFNRFGCEVEAVFGKQIQRLRELGLLEDDETSKDRIRLTCKGRLLGNQVFMQFVGDDVVEAV